jgi:hypothetical protein
MGTARSPVVVLDAGPLVQFERGDQFVRAMVRAAVRKNHRLVIPSGVLAQVWRDGTRQARLASLLARPGAHVEPLDERMAKAAGALCGRARTSDVVDASVVLTARLYKAVVVTGEPADLRRLDPHVEIEAI